MDSILEATLYKCGFIETTVPTWKHRPRPYMKRSQILYVTNGVLYMDEDGTEYACKKGEVLLLDRFKPNFGNKPSGGHMSFYWILFEGVLPPGIQKQFPLVNRYYPEHMMKQLLYFDNTPEYPAWAKDYLVRLILLELLRQSDLRAEGVSPLVESIKNYIMSNCSKNITVTEVSDEFGYNSDYLSKLFAEKSNTSLHDFIRDARINYIKDLLLSREYPLKEVAMMSGFSEPSYFFKYFKYHEKTTPTQFIKANKSMPDTIQ